MYIILLSPSVLIIYQFLGVGLSVEKYPYPISGNHGKVFIRGYTVMYFTTWLRSDTPASGHLLWVSLLYTTVPGLYRSIFCHQATGQRVKITKVHTRTGTSTAAFATNGATGVLVYISIICSSGTVFRLVTVEFDATYELRGLSNLGSTYCRVNSLCSVIVSMIVHSLQLQVYFYYGFRSNYILERRFNEFYLQLHEWSTHQPTLSSVEKNCESLSFSL